MAGFSRGRITLVWSPGHELHGFEVVCRRRPFGEVLDDWLSEPAEKVDYDALSRAEKVERSRRHAEELAAVIVAWNMVDDDGEPVPWPPVDGTYAPYEWPPRGGEAREAGAAVLLAYCDGDMIRDMQEAYQTATTRVAPPLPESSESGPSDLPAAPTEPMPEQWDMPTPELINPV